MMMEAAVLAALVLVCSINAASCNEQQARMVLRVPEASALPFACLRNGLAYIAGSRLEVGEDEIVKVVCTRAIDPAITVSGRR
jgi:hypothetical protein